MGKQLWQPHKGDKKVLVGELTENAELATATGRYLLPDHQLLQQEIRVIEKYWDKFPALAIVYRGSKEKDGENYHDYVVLRAGPTVSPFELSDVLKNYSKDI